MGFMKKFIVAILLFIITLTADALTIPDKPRTRVVDFAHILNSSQQQELINKIDNIYTKTQGSEIEILIINSLEGQSIDEFAIQTARKWQLGQKGKDNGILIIVSKSDKQSRIEVGYGLEGVIPDGFAGTLQRQVLAPNFESGNYYQGLSLTVDRLAQQISKDFTTQPIKQPQNDDQLTWVVIGASIGIIILLFVTGHGDMAISLLYLLLSVLGNRGNRSNRKDDDIGGGGGFGGGGSSGKWR